MNDFCVLSVSDNAKLNSSWRIWIGGRKPDMDMTFTDTDIVRV